VILYKEKNQNSHYERQKPCLSTNCGSIRGGYFFKERGVQLPSASEMPVILAINGGIG
jgi:hypothetical protein